jgi:ketosteroid isomerase-like protein
MRRIAILFVVSVVGVLCLAKYTVQGAETDAQLKQEVLKISEEREQALGRGDVATLDRIDADDLVYTNWRGITLTKAEHQADVKARRLSFQTNFKHSDVQVVIHGNTGIVTGVSATNVTYKGSVMSGSRKFVNVYAKENGEWHCVVHFETPVAQ